MSTGGTITVGGDPAGVMPGVDVPDAGGITDDPPLMVPSLQPSTAPGTRIPHTNNPADFGDMPLWWDVSRHFVSAGAAFGHGQMHTRFRRASVRE